MTPTRSPSSRSPLQWKLLMTHHNIFIMDKTRKYLVYRNIRDGCDYLIMC